MGLYTMRGSHLSEYFRDKNGRVCEPYKDLAYCVHCQRHIMKDQLKTRKDGMKICPICSLPIRLMARVKGKRSKRKVHRY